MIMTTLEKFGLSLAAIGLVIRLWRLNVPLALLAFGSEFCLPHSALGQPWIARPTYAVQLNWDAVLDPEVDAYYVYWGTTSRSYTSRTNIGNTTKWTLAGLTRGGRWYFAVTAANTNGLESDFSDEVSITSPPAPKLRLGATLQAAASPAGPWHDLATITVDPSLDPGLDPGLSLNPTRFYRSYLTTTWLTNAVDGIP